MVNAMPAPISQEAMAANCRVPVGDRSVAKNLYSTLLVSVTLKLSSTFFKPSNNIDNQQ
jgi:hypothetical protein